METGGAASRREKKELWKRWSEKMRGSGEGG